MLLSKFSGNTKVRKERYTAEPADSRSLRNIVETEKFYVCPTYEP